MPSTKRTKPLYQRGDFRLFRRQGRSALEIVWYDESRKRERSVSARTMDVAAGKEALDRIYLERTKGEAFCPTCGQRRDGTSVLVTTAIADYLILSEAKASIKAIRPRLAHVLNYLVHLNQITLVCGQIDKDWIARFRTWLAKIPIISPTGEKCIRSLSTIENSVLQLAAAINACGGVTANFKAQQPKDVNQTPQFRASVGDLAAMFRYCVDPPHGKLPNDRCRKDRARLLAFLRISVATLARPDAAHDVSTKPNRAQWNSTKKVLNLNPKGRQQTKKYRAIIPVPDLLVDLLNDTDGPFVRAVSVRSAWRSMAIELKLPSDGESGMKLIRRSMADNVRDRLPTEAWGELEIWLGHDRFDDVSELYAPFRPDYLRRALVVINAIIDEIEAAVPSAFTGR
jgi:hypothetical protein